MATNPRLQPGYFQSDKSGSVGGVVGGPRLVGRKTGREAPRDHGSQPAWEDTLQRHDLMPMHRSQVGSNANFNSNQGQLFDPETVSPRSTQPDAERSRDLGSISGRIQPSSSKKSTGLAGQPGFMPTLTNSQKISALGNVAEARVATGADRGTCAPIAEMMADRAALSAKGRTQSWYMGVGADGKHSADVQGDAPRKVVESAARVGNTTSGHTRAVANTSPQMGWKAEGTTNDKAAAFVERSGAATAGDLPNIHVAENVVRSVNKAYSTNPNISDAEVTQVSQGAMDKHGGDINAMARAGADHVSRLRGAEHGDYNVSSFISQKAPNFEASLNLSHPDKAVQRVASQSYTVDRHDLSGVGIDPDSPAWKRRGTYEAVAMTGRRSALRNRELPPNEQARQWEARRSETHRGEGNQMFTSGTGYDGGTPQVRPDLLPKSPAAPAKSRSLQRGKRDIASDLGLDF